MAVGSENGDSTRFDEFLARFEIAWGKGERPDLNEFVAEAAAEPDAAELIEALMLTDMEWHWRRPAETRRVSTAVSQTVGQTPTPTAATATVCRSTTIA